MDPPSPREMDFSTHLPRKKIFFLLGHTRTLKTREAGGPLYSQEKGPLRLSLFSHLSSQTTLIRNTCFYLFFRKKNQTCSIAISSNIAVDDSTNLLNACTKSEAKKKCTVHLGQFPRIGSRIRGAFQTMLLPLLVSFCSRAPCDKKRNLNTLTPGPLPYLLQYIPQEWKERKNLFLDQDWISRPHLPGISSACSADGDQVREWREKTQTLPVPQHT